MIERESVTRKFSILYSVKALSPLRCAKLTENFKVANLSSLNFQTAGSNFKAQS